MLRKIFGPKRDEVARKWRRLHNQQLHDVYRDTKYYSGEKIKMNGMGGTSSNVWGRGEVHTGVWWGNLKERDHMEDLSINW